MAQQELNLFQLSSRLMAKSCTGATQVVRCDRCQTTAFGVCLHNCPDHLGRKTVARDSACLIDGPQQWTRIYTGSKTPTVDRLLHPCRNGDGPDMTAFPSPGRDHPTAFPKLQILDP